MPDKEKPVRIMAATGKPETETNRIRQEALDWLQRLTSGAMTQADLETFESWRGQSAEHRDAVAEANLLWDVLGKVAREANARPVARSPLNGPIGRRALLAGATAAGAAYLAFRPPFHLWPAASELMATYHTETGEHRQLAVASGITLEMDTRTSLNVPVAKGQLYSLELISGQLAVSIGATSMHSVVVSAAGGQSRAEQGKFNVRYEDSGVCITCSEGTVDISYNSRSLTLHSGQQVTYGDHGLEPVVATDPSVAMAWQRGLLLFRDVPLARVIDEVNRYRRGRIILLNRALGERRVVAGFRLDQIDAVVDYFQQAFGAKIHTLAAGVVLLS
jgi:transmembrane sensor